MLLAAALSFGFIRLLVALDNGYENLGPTAATLHDAGNELWGTILGLVVGTGLAAFSVRRGSRLTSGVVTGVLAYGVLVVGSLIHEGRGDLGLGEAVALFALVGCFLLIPIALGSAVGSFIGTARERHSS